jgi:hypothetical protein
MMPPQLPFAKTSSCPTLYLQHLPQAQALALYGMDKGNFDSLLDLDAAADEIDDGIYDGSLDFNDTLLSSEPSMMLTSNPLTKPSSNL